MAVLHPSFRSLLIFTAEQLELVPDIIIHECTEIFPWELYDSLSAHQLGAPITRPRQWIVAHKRGSVANVGSPMEFGWLYSRDVKLTGHSFFVASPEQLASMATTMARRRRGKEAPVRRSYDQGSGPPASLWHFRS